MYILWVLRTIAVWGWSPILIMALALAGIRYEWSFWTVVLLTGIALIAGLIATVVRVGERRLELVSMRLRRLARYFSRRFTGTSSLSIFAIIDTLFNIDDPQLWDWARACDMSARLFNTWCDSFVDRIESDTRAGMFRTYLRIHLDELWLLTSHYYEFVEQFYEIAEKVEVTPATRDQYNRFVVEYNTFVQNFREHIAELKKAAGTEIEPPSVKLANELSALRPAQAVYEEEAKPPKAPEHRGGHYL